MNLISTRDKSNVISALGAVLKGIADDGGLYVPSVFPRIDKQFIEEIKELDYARCAARVLGLFFDIPESELSSMCREAYASFDTKEIAPIRRLGDHEFVLELFHGPTLAFKDMALQMLPRLMSAAITRFLPDKDIIILTATSGDTGKAALEGFRDVDRTNIVVFYPAEGVSDMQRLQMVTQEGKNVYVCAVNGNFDDAQTGVKRIFADRAYNDKLNEEGFILSSANSINFGRLAPQIVYYVYAYARLAASGELRNGDPLNVTVPTGNFGNILAAYYASKMGLPIAKLLCASNQNNVLTDFFESGRYMKNRMFFKTISPSMDILISSNLERYIFEIGGRNDGLVAEWMDQLASSGEYDMSDNFLTRTRGIYADFANDKETSATIKRVFSETGYLMDPHTAVGKCVYDKHQRTTGDPTTSLLVSTASPFKFVGAVYKALTSHTVEDPFAAARDIGMMAKLPVPRQIRDLENAKVRFGEVIDPADMQRKLDSLIK